MIESTCVYTAPEIFEGKPATQQSNVYSFGVLMYQMIANATFYTSIQNNEEERSKLIEKIVKENYRPEFNSPIKESMKKLIEKCWSKDPNDRPSFNELFNRLALNVEGQMYDVFGENKYYLDGIDIKEVQKYAENVDLNELEKLKEELNCFENLSERLLDMNSELKAENIKLKIEIQKMKNQDIDLPNIKEQVNITINEFNSLSLQSKQSIISEIINALPEFKTNQFFINVNNLLLYLLKFDQTRHCKCFKFLTDDTTNILAYNDQKFEIQFQYELIEMLLNCNVSELNEHLQSIENVLIEFKYPSKSFDFFDLNINKMQQNRKKSIKFALFITGVTKTDIKNRPKDYINYVKIDSMVTEIQGGIPINSFSGTTYKGTFYNWTSLISVEIPSSVKIIGKGAFRSCTSLQSIKIPSSITFIDDEAFENCESLTHIDLPYSVAFLGKNVFSSCKNLINLINMNIKQNIPIINSSFLSGCSSLAKVNLPSSITAILDDSFNGCTNLRCIEIPFGVKSIGCNAFKDCSLLSEINIPSSVMSIGSGAFEGCSSLSEFEILSGWNSIVPSLLSKCTIIIQN